VPDTLRLHPDAPSRFLWRGRPRFLLGSTEHYGAILHAAFDHDAYLDTIAADDLSLTRVFAFFRELPDSLEGGVCGVNTLAPSPADYLAPWPRAEGDAAGPDWLPRFDLDQWDERYFRRLRGFVDAASRRGVVVELVLFANPYTETQWRFSPLHPSGNVNGVGGRLTSPQQSMTLHDPSVVMHQRRFVRRVAAELNECDNVYYEICNEPWLMNGPSGSWSDAARLRDWQMAMIAELRDAERSLSNRHLGAINAHMDLPVDERSPRHTGDAHLDDELYLAEPEVDVINVHYVSQRVTVDGVIERFTDGAKDPDTYRFGNVAAFVAARSPLRKPVCFDEDYTGIAFGLAPRPAQNRLEAWESLVGGCAAYDHLDFTFTPADPTGRGADPRAADVPAWWFDGRPLRRHLSHLASFAASLDLASLTPDRLASERLPAGTDACIARDVSGSLVAVVVDRRAINAGFGATDLSGTVELRAAPSTRYQIGALSPCTGDWTALGEAAASLGGTLRVDVPPFREDVVLHAVPQRAGR
jgi:hypothetical protein